jgi:CubicO group peptidase (beta-lactamase class C family)
MYIRYDGTRVQLFAVILAFLLCWQGASRSFIYAQSYDFRALDRLLEDSVARISGVGGGYSLVLIHNGREIYNKAFTAPGRTYSSDRLVPIASATKWLAAGVIMGMVDDGSWRLEDSAAQYLPFLSGDKARMTMRQLFSLMSGINEDGDGVNDEILRNTSITLDSAVRAVLALPLRVPPGGAMMYGGRGMHVAGRCAEIASRSTLPTGQAWNALFARYVTQPLGLRATLFTGGANPGIAGSVVSSANEYKVYLQMLLSNGVWNGRRVLSQESVRQMHRNQTGTAPILYSPYAQLAPFLPGVDRNTRYGIGNWCEVTDARSGEVLESSSQGAFGFSPWIDWRRNLIGVWSVQSQLVAVQTTYLRMKELVRQAIDRVTSVQHVQTTQALYLYPQPASENLMISGFHGTASITLTNILGQQVLAMRDVSAPAQVDVSLLPQGIYFCRVIGHQMPQGVHDIVLPMVVAR